MTRYLGWLVLGCCLLCLGCAAQQRQLTSTAVETAVASNAGMVAALTAVQTRARALRKAAMVTAAEQATSREQGERRLDAIDQQYAPVFEAFIVAAAIQNALADTLEAARAAVDAGEQPDMARLIKLYGALQDCYGAVMVALAEVTK